MKVAKKQEKTHLMSHTGVLKTCLWSSILDFLGPEFLEAQCIWKANSAKLAMQMSEKEGETGILGASL